MDENEFRSTLDNEVTCSACRRKIADLEWAVTRRDEGDWMGICICKCPRCSMVLVGAAGSSPPAHAEAQATRAKVLEMEKM